MNLVSERHRKNTFIYLIFFQLIFWRKEDLPLVEKDLLTDHVGSLNTHKSVSPDRMHL